MSFLSKIRGAFGSGDEPSRWNASFAPAPFRPASFAKPSWRATRRPGAGSGVQIDAAAVLSPAINPVAETLLAAETEAADEASICPPSGRPRRRSDAMGRSSRLAVAALGRNPQLRRPVLNWDYDLQVLHFLAAAGPDAGVAAHIFWLTAASRITSRSATTSRPAR
jgi:hypothetical protein